MPQLIPLIIGAGSAIFGAFKGGAKAAASNPTGTLEGINAFGGQLSPLLRLFTPSEEGKQKQAATRIQQQIEASAKDVQQQLSEGLMDPETAIRRLESVEQMALAMMNSESIYFQQGGALASRTVANVMAVARQASTANINQPFDPDRGFTGSVRNQKAQLGSNLRELFAGGTSGLEGTNAEKIFGTFDAIGSVPKAGKLTEDVFGTRGPSERLRNLVGEGEEPSAFDELSRRKEARSFKGLDELNFNENRNPLEEMFLKNQRFGNL